jgi:hypothetical protein
VEDSQAAAFLLWNTSAAGGTAAQLLLPLGTQDAPGVDFSGSTNLLLRCVCVCVRFSWPWTKRGCRAWMQWSPLLVGTCSPCPAFVRRLSRPAPRLALGLAIGSTIPYLYANVTFNITLMQVNVTVLGPGGWVKRVSGCIHRRLEVVVGIYKT